MQASAQKTFAQLGSAPHSLKMPIAGRLDCPREGCGDQSGNGKGTGRIGVNGKKCVGGNILNAIPPIVQSSNLNSH